MKPTKISFEEIVNNIPWRQIESFSPNFVVGIEDGGTFLSALVAFRLKAELILLKSSFYDNSKPAKKKHPQPIIHTKKSLECLTKKRILLVDDICNSGSTLAAVKKLLLSKAPEQVKTLVYAGKADFSCYPFERCLLFPWED